MKNTCSICSATFPSVPPQGGASGYAVRPDGSHICYSCADSAQRRELKDRSRPFGAYLSSDGRSVTSWTGGALMRVISSSSVRLTRRSWIHGSTIQAVRAVDCHGGHWYGRGSAGICLTLRPCKAA